MDDPSLFSSSAWNEADQTDIQIVRQMLTSDQSPVDYPRIKIED